MKAVWAAILLAAIFFAGVIYFFNLNFAAGDVYPEYSSLRSDPRGTKILYESLRRIAGVRVERNFQPLDLIPPAGTGTTVLMLGYTGGGPEEKNPYEKWIGAGNRLVVALADERRTLRGFDLKTCDAVDKKIKECRIGQGALVLLTSPELFVNSTLAKAPRTLMMSRVLGGNKTIIFDESHFGIVESGSIVGMGRRFRLGGLALGLALCAVLFLWRSIPSFPPAHSAAVRDSVSGRTAQSGLITLLRRNVPASDVARLCWAEYRKSAGRDLPARRAQIAETILHDGRAPVDALKEIHSALHSKGAH